MLNVPYGQTSTFSLHENSVRRGWELEAEERISRAIAYMEEHDYLTVKGYAELNGLSVSTASVELRKLRSDASSGIRAIGKRSGLMYVKR